MPTDRIAVLLGHADARMVECVYVRLDARQFGTEELVDGDLGVRLLRSDDDRAYPASGRAGDAGRVRRSR
jgi:hypothetical protein